MRLTARLVRILSIVVCSISAVVFIGLRSASAASTRHSSRLRSKRSA
jgi:hypothetical protein